MKAVVLREAGRPGNLSIEDWETPEPQAGEVRVKVKTSALNRRDYWLTVGRYPEMKLPCVLGSDGAGIVDAVGAGVDSVRVGDQVVIYPAREWGDDSRWFGKEFRVLGMPDPGTFSEFHCAPAADVFPKPAHLSWEQAAAVPLAGLTAWRAVVTQAELQTGQKLLVRGAGSGVSTFAILWGIHLGAEVYVSSGTDEKIEKAKAMGVVGWANYREEDCYKRLRDASGGFDVIIDGSGGEELNDVLDSLSPGGRYVFFGATTGAPSKGLELPKLFWRQVRLQGTTMGSPAEFKAMLEFLGQRKIEPVIDCVLPVDHIADAIQRLEAFSQIGKIVLRNEVSPQ